MAMRSNTVQGTPEEWARLAALLVARRMQLGLRVADIVGPGLSASTVSLVENGNRSGQPRARRALALWGQRLKAAREDELELILHGEEPRWLDLSDVSGSLVARLDADTLRGGVLLDEFSRTTSELRSLIAEIRVDLDVIARRLDELEGR